MIIYLAGWEASTTYGLKMQKGLNIFLSYFYSKRAEKALTLAQTKDRGTITIDSGAHTFFINQGMVNASHKAKVDRARRQDRQLPAIDKYHAAYVEWVKKWQNLFDYFVELDLQELVGHQKIMQWRERWQREGLAHKLITVYHYSDTWKQFEQMVADSQSKYVATQGFRMDEHDINYLKLVGYCYKRGVRVHGFALTKNKLLCEVPFYSVDSTTWNSPATWGHVIIERNKMRSQIRTPKWNPNIRKDFLKLNIPLEFIGGKTNSGENYDADIARKKLLEAIRVVRSTETYFTKLWKERGIDYDSYGAN